MEDQQAITEPTQHFENIDFNSSPDENNKESSIIEDNEQVRIQFYASFKNKKKTPIFSKKSKDIRTLYHNVIISNSLWMEIQSAGCHIFPYKYRDFCMQW